MLVCCQKLQDLVRRRLVCMVPKSESRNADVPLFFLLKLKHSLFYLLVFLPGVVWLLVLKKVE